MVETIAATTATVTTVSGFANLGLDNRLVDALSGLGYEEPTPIQREAIPPLIEGRDLIGQAATGTGKTAAFALPVLHRLSTLATRTRPTALILVPTRELAMQVAESVERYGKPLGIRVLPVYGGTGMDVQLRALHRGVDVVVATPGRALDHLRRGSLTLSEVAVVVLDEADEMLDMGFAEDIEALLSATPTTRQTVLFSATMAPRIRSIAGRHLTNAVEIVIARAPVAAGSAPRVRQTAYLVPRAHKLAALGRVLDVEAPKAALIFCKTRSEVDQLTEALAARGYRPEALHGGMSQDQRDRVMRLFRSGQADLLVATDVAARGLDVDHLTHVVNYQLPLGTEAYVHRIGRVGRAGREGVALTVAEPREQSALRAIERVTGQRIEFARVPTAADLHARRAERTKDAIRATIAEGELDRFRGIVESLASEFDPTAIALAALKLAHRAEIGDAPDEPDIPTTVPEAARTPMRARGPHQQQTRSPGPRLARIYISAGREAGIAPRDLVGAIANEAGLPGRDIRGIEITDRFSIVEVPEDAAEHVIESLNGARLRGRRVSARRDRH
ncbi:DEAD/DEAH box helicase [Gemmata sp. G18]|uniref:RNA helicase n=1 Tax=Gemmata palustris TaxID=2822762 RepID=A0ABS5BLU4_9BACT|nr:DEAD/DEAH box helicase [Gemmata palustris]MBP3954679.1 DEAD/DEAH box helicase [Gemmata palustris]